MTSSVRRRNHHARRDHTDAQAGTNVWLAPPIGVVVIVGLAFAASRAQASAELFVAAALTFSLCEGAVLALVGWAWSRRGILAAVVAASVTAALAAPVRWWVGSVAGYLQTSKPANLLEDLLVSVAWGAIAGLAGATILRSRLAALMHSDRERFKPRPRD
jgi:hypothetical protein